MVSVNRAVEFTTLLIYFVNKRQVLSKGLVTSVARLFLIVNGIEWRINICANYERIVTVSIAGSWIME